MPERRITSPGLAVVEIDELDDALDETVCLSCGRPAAVCPCFDAARDIAAREADAQDLRRRLREQLARARAAKGLEGLRETAALVAAGPRWLLWAALRWSRREKPEK